METGKDLILVTGGTGNQGGAIARELLAKGNRVRVMTRRPEAAAELAKLGAEVVRGDFDDATSLKRAVEGAWGAFSVQNTWEVGVEREEEQGKRFAEIARAGGVRHLVYSSVGSADRGTGIPHFENKFRIEETIRGLGFPSHTIVRPVFFMENFMSPFFLPALQQGRLAVAVRPDTKLQMIAVQDIGKHGARAFERHAELNGQAIDLAGDEHTMPETAAILGQAMRHETKFVPVPIEEVRKFSDDYATMLEWFDRVGYDVDIAGLARETGIAPTALAAWATTARWSPAATAAR